MTREEMIGALYEDDKRVQYDGNDEARIAEAGELLTNCTIDLINALGQYRDALNAEVTEDSKDEMGYIRRNLVERVASAQAAISRLAWSLRIDMTEGYERLVTALGDENGIIDMRGL